MCMPRTPTKICDRVAAAEAKAVMVWYVGLLTHCYREKCASDSSFCPIEDGGGWVTVGDEALVLHVLCTCGQMFNDARHKKLCGGNKHGDGLVGSCVGMFNFRKLTDKTAARRAFSRFEGMASALRKGAGVDDIRDSWLYRAPLEDQIQGPRMSAFSPLYLSPQGSGQLHY